MASSAVLVVVGGALLAWMHLRDATRDVDSAEPHPRPRPADVVGVRGPPGEDLHEEHVVEWGAQHVQSGMVQDLRRAGEVEADREELRGGIVEPSWSEVVAGRDLFDRSPESRLDSIETAPIPMSRMEGHSAGDVGYPDHLEVEIHGAPALNVGFSEVGLKDSESRGVGGAITPLRTHFELG